MNPRPPLSPLRSVSLIYEFFIELISPIYKIMHEFLTRRILVKRRFVRQNREIARVNSIQSLRIRSLESEVSHLLSENVSLREQSISLSQELERYEAAKMLKDGVGDIKAKLDSKLAELNTLVADLGSLPRKCGKLYQESTESAESKYSRLSNFDLRRRATESEHNADGKLPVILEDKCYPRKTLEYVFG